MMVAEQIENCKENVDRRFRTPEYLLKKYKTKQPGEINSKNVNLMKEWRENQSSTQTNGRFEYYRRFEKTSNMDNH